MLSLLIPTGFRKCYLGPRKRGQNRDQIRANAINAPGTSFLWVINCDELNCRSDFYDPCLFGLIWCTLNCPSGYKLRVQAYNLYKYVSHRKFIGRIYFCQLCLFGHFLRHLGDHMGDKRVKAAHLATNSEYLTT